jgi:hypothetical protein
MAEREELVASIVATTADYRAVPTSAHVERWIKQFDASAQLPMLRELDHVLKQTYFSLANTRVFLAGLFRTTKLVGEDACGFWKGVKFLNIQGGGVSQKDMLALLSNVLEKECGFGTESCGIAPHAFVYLDDAIFTGNRAGRDIQGWIASEAPAEARLHIVTIASHTGGQYYASQEINKAARAAGKKIALTWWRAVELEDRKIHTTISDVLRPVGIPDDEAVRAYVDGMNHKLTSGRVETSAVRRFSPMMRVDSFWRNNSS